MCSTKESHDSDADLDVDGDDTLEYAKPSILNWSSWDILLFSGAVVGTETVLNYLHLFLTQGFRYTEADIIPCSGEDQGEAKEREALRGLFWSKLKWFHHRL